jgi:hypothetical protein
MASISEQQRKERARSVSSSEGSLAMEGQYLDASTRSLNERYISGELTLEQFSLAIDRHVAQLAESLRENQLAKTA